MNALTEITLCSMCSQSPLVEVFKKKCGAIYIAQSMIALFEMGKIVVFVDLEFFRIATQRMRKTIEK